MTDVISDLSYVAVGLSPAGQAVLERAAAEIAHLRRQRDHLQDRGTELVMENRDLRAQIAGHPVVRAQRVGSHELPLPTYATDGAAGMDLRANLRGSVLRLRPGARDLISCGFAFEIPEGYLGDVRGRSGWTSRGVYVIHGLIDPDYRGIVGIHVENRSAEEVEIAHGDRIAQLVIAQAPQARLEEVSELSETTRNTAGFGSTGVR